MFGPLATREKGLTGSRLAKQWRKAITIYTDDDDDDDGDEDEDEKCLILVEALSVLNIYLVFCANFVNGSKTITYCVMHVCVRDADDRAKIAVCNYRTARVRDRERHVSAIKSVV